MTTVSDREDNVLRFDRHFAGAPELVFALWTVPELLTEWFAGSHGFRAEVEEFDPRPGGRWRLVNRKGEVVEHPHGVYHEVVPPSRLLYSYQYAGTDFHSTVSVDLSPEGEGTRMRFCQTGFPDSASRDEHVEGWSWVWKLFENALLARHGAGTVYDVPVARRTSEIERDIAEARRRMDEERQAAGRD